MKKVILFVHQSADLYGSDRVLLTLVANLDRQKFLPIVFLPVNGPLVEELAAVDCECHVLLIAILSRATLSFRGLLNLPVTVIKSIRAFTRALNGRQVNVVHSNTLAVLSGAIWAYWHKVPHVWHVHEIIVHPKFVRKAYALLLSYFSDRIICVSHATKRNLLRDQPSLEKRIHVVWNGLTRVLEVDAQVVRQYRHQVCSKDGDVLIALVGRINRLKGHRLLVDAAGILWQRGVRNLRFVIVGSAVPGQEHFVDALQHAISESPAGQCFLLQPFTKDVWSVWDACDIAVIPSTEPESFGMVALEAMAASKAVVASNHGGVTEIVIDGQTGILVPPGDASALAEALEKLSADLMLRLEVGNAGLLRYQREFTLERYVANISLVYATL